MGKLHFTSLMDPPIGDLTLNVQFLVDDPLDVVHLFHRGPFVHMPVVLLNFRPQNAPDPIKPTQPVYGRHFSIILGPWLIFFLFSPTSKHIEGLQKLGFRTHFLADDATVKHCFFRVGFFKEWGNICSEATLLLPAFGLCVNLLHRTKFW
jgi:hypothetical protein